MSLSLLLTLALQGQAAQGASAKADSLCPTFPKGWEVYKSKVDTSYQGLVEHFLEKGFGPVVLDGKVYGQGRKPLCITPFTKSLYGMLRDIEYLKEKGDSAQALVEELDSLFQAYAPTALSYFLNTYAGRGSVAHAYPTASPATWPLPGQEEGWGVAARLLSALGLSVEGPTVVIEGARYDITTPQGAMAVAEWLNHTYPPNRERVEEVEALMGSYRDALKLLQALHYVNMAEAVLKECSADGNCYPYRDGVFDEAETYLKEAWKLVGGGNDE